MINILLSGNKKVFDGSLTLAISIMKRTKEPINIYIFTAKLTRLKPEFIPIEDEQIAFLRKVLKSKNKKNEIHKIDVTELYDKAFKNCPNETAYCTPYTLLRLLADQVPEIPNKILYLDIDMMCGGDLSELYHIDITDYEYAAVKEKYGCWIIRPDYINAGMLLLNMKKIRENGTMEKARKMLQERKLLFADQDALFWNTTKKKILPRIYNEQSRFNDEKTVICHFSKRLLFWPYPHTENYKQWNVDEVHSVLKCYRFDEDLEEYLKLKEEYKKTGKYLEKDKKN